MRAQMKTAIEELSQFPRPPANRVKVVNVRDADAPACVYVGRPMPKRYVGSVFANPFKVGMVVPGWGKIDRGEAVLHYARWLAGGAGFPSLDAQRLSVIEEFPLLRARICAGLPLGCWCAPAACHADVLVAMAEAMEGLPIDAAPDFRIVLPKFIW